MLLLFRKGDKGMMEQAEAVMKVLALLRPVVVSVEPDFHTLSAHRGLVDSQFYGVN